jgi:hypothetical protein
VIFVFFFLRPAASKMLAVAQAMPVLFAPTGHKNKVVKISPLVTEGSLVMVQK